MGRFSQIAVISLFLVSPALSQFGTNYNAGDHGRSETVSPDGEVQGQYQYTDPEGKLITVKYRAGKEGFQVEGDHLPTAPQAQAAGPQNQQPYFSPQQPQFFNSQPQPQQFQSQPQSQFFNTQPQQQSQFFNSQPQPQQQQFNPFFNQQQTQPQATQQPSSFFQNFGNNAFQSHPNALPGQLQPQQSQFYAGQGQTGGGQHRPAKVTVSQSPGAGGFTYNIESYHNSS